MLSIPIFNFANKNPPKRGINVENLQKSRKKRDFAKAHLLKFNSRTCGC